MAAVEPTGRRCIPPFEVAETRSSGSCPADHVLASQSTVTVVSRPEKPPIAATSAPEGMIDWRRARLRRDHERAAAVGLDVGERGGQTADVSPPNIPPPPRTLRRRVAGRWHPAAVRRTLRRRVAGRWRAAARAARPAARRPSSARRSDRRRGTSSSSRARASAPTRTPAPAAARPRPRSRPPAAPAGRTRAAGRARRRASHPRSASAPTRGRSRCVPITIASVTAPPSSTSGPATDARVSSE